MSNIKTQLYCELLDAARKQTLQLAAGVPENKRFFQIQEGKATPAWLLGHLANSLNALVLTYMFQDPSVFSKEESLRFAPDIAGGSPPTANPEEYLPWDEIVNRYNTVFDRALAALAKLDDSDLPQPLPERAPQRVRDHFASVEATLGFIVSHDAYHRGQMGLLGKLT